MTRRAFISLLGGAAAGGAGAAVGRLPLCALACIRRSQSVTPRSRAVVRAEPLHHGHARKGASSEPVPIQPSLQ